MTTETPITTALAASTISSRDTITDMSTVALRKTATRVLGRGVAPRNSSKEDLVDLIAERSFMLRDVRIGVVKVIGEIETMGGLIATVNRWAMNCTNANTGYIRWGHMHKLALKRIKTSDTNIAAAALVLSQVRDASGQGGSVDPQAFSAEPDTNHTEPDHIVEVTTGSKAEKGAASDLGDALSFAMHKAVRDALNSSVDEQQVERIAERVYTRLDRPQNVVVENKRTDQRVDVGMQHKRFADVLQLIGAGLNVYLHGPAGSGKTECARAVARAIEARDLAIFSMNRQMMRSELLGYMTADGRYVSTTFRDVYENGGLLMLDEMDRGNERVMVALNSAIENHVCLFPDGMVDMHADTFVIAAGNTALHGADRQYVSAAQQDAAFIERFALVEWGYDERFETALVRNLFDEDQRPMCDYWLKKVRAVRAEIGKLGLRYTCSPRRAIQGAKLLRIGASLSLINESILFGGWSPEDQEKVRERVGQRIKLDSVTA